MLKRTALDFGSCVTRRAQLQTSTCIYIYVCIYIYIVHLGRIMMQWIMQVKLCCHYTTLFRLDKRAFASWAFSSRSAQHRHCICSSRAHLWRWWPGSLCGCLEKLRRGAFLNFSKWAPRTVFRTAPFSPFASSFFLLFNAASVSTPWSSNDLSLKSNAAATPMRFRVSGAARLDFVLAATSSAVMGRSSGMGVSEGSTHVANLGSSSSSRFHSRTKLTNVAIGTCDIYIYTVIYIYSTQICVLLPKAYKL